MEMIRKIHVKAGKGYDILIGRGLLGRAGELCKEIRRGRKAVIVTDETVAALYGKTVRESFEAAGFETHLFAFPAGEPQKNHKTLLLIYDFLADRGLTRADLVVALGGGVPGAVAGFAAATFKRGVDFVQIPTTLLAQIDSSIGGKTGVDLKQGKNLVGAFWQPRRVLCDPDALKTLDSRIFADGMAEVIKHACIRDRALFDALAARESLEGFLDELIARNIAIKSGVGERDEQEAGERMLLNFGHTLGHAIEKLAGYGKFTHGEAVAMGMALITTRSEEKGLTEPGTAERIGRVLAKYGLPADCPLPLDQIRDAAANDKKLAGGRLNLVLLSRIGEGFIHPVPEEGLGEFLGVS